MSFKPPSYILTIFKKLIALLIYNSYKIYNSMVFRIFTKLYNHHHNQFRTFLSPQKNLLAIITHFPLSSYLKPSLRQRLFSASMDLLLEVSYKWNHIIYMAFCD